MVEGRPSHGSGQIVAGGDAPHSRLLPPQQLHLLGEYLLVWQEARKTGRAPGCAMSLVILYVPTAGTGNTAWADSLPPPGHVDFFSTSVHLPMGQVVTPSEACRRREGGMVVLSESWIGKPSRRFRKDLTAPLSVTLHSLALLVAGWMVQCRFPILAAQSRSLHRRITA